MDMQTFFKMGMARDIPQLLEPPADWLVGFDLGATGDKQMPDCTALGLPDWRAPFDPIPAHNGTVDIVHAYHFLEHLTGDHVIQVLRDVERVLKTGGIMNICVPYYNSSLMAQDLTHKSFWNEATLPNLFNCSMYDPAGTWKLRIHANFIIGIVERNLALMMQLVKGE